MGSAAQPHVGIEDPAALQAPCVCRQPRAGPEADFAITAVVLRFWPRVLPEFFLLLDQHRFTLENVFPSRGLAVFSRVAISLSCHDCSPFAGCGRTGRFLVGERARTDPLRSRCDQVFPAGATVYVDRPRYLVQAIEAFTPPVVKVLSHETPAGCRTHTGHHNSATRKRATLIDPCSCRCCLSASVRVIGLSCRRAERRVPNLGLCSAVLGEADVIC